MHGRFRRFQQFTAIELPTLPVKVRRVKFTGVDCVLPVEQVEPSWRVTKLPLTTEVCHLCSWQFPSSNSMQQWCSFANYENQQQKHLWPSMRFMEITPFINPLCTTGTSKNYQESLKISSVVGLQHQGTIKCNWSSHNEEHRKSQFSYWSSYVSARCHLVGKDPAKWTKIGSCTMTMWLVKPPVQCSSFWWRNELQQSPNYRILQISLCATSAISQDPRLDSKVILYLKKKFNTIMQHISQP